MKYRSELNAGRFGRFRVFEPKTSGRARYISENTFARSAVASMVQKIIFNVLNDEDVTDHRNEGKAFKRAPGGFSV